MNYYQLACEEYGGLIGTVADKLLDHRDQMQVDEENKAVGVLSYQIAYSSPASDRMPKMSFDFREDGGPKSDDWVAVLNVWSTEERWVTVNLLWDFEAGVDIDIDIKTEITFNGDSQQPEEWTYEHLEQVMLALTAMVLFSAQFVNGVPNE